MTLRTACLTIVGYWFCSATLLSVAVATEGTTPESPTPSAVRAECAENIRQLHEEIAAEQKAGAAVSSSLLDQLALWRQIDLVATQRAANLQTTKLARSPEALSTAEITRFLELEEARDKLAVTESKLETLKVELQSERSLMLQTKELLQRAQQDRRRLTEELLDASAVSRGSLQIQQRLEELRIRLHDQQRLLHLDTITEMTRQEEELESIIADRRDLIDRAGSKIRLSKEEVEQELGKIAGMERTVRGHLAELDKQMHLLLTDSSDETPAANTKLDVIREESQLLRQLLTEIAAIRECWKRRYQFSQRQGSEDEWSTWREDAIEAQDRLQTIITRLANRTLQRRQQAAAIRRQVAAGERAQGSPSQELVQIDAIIDAYGALQVLAGRAQRLYARFTEDVEDRQDRYSISHLISWASSRIRACWEFELTAVDDRSVTVGKLVIAFGIFIVGLIISKAISSIVAFRILPRFGFNRAAATTVRQMMLYALIVAMTMLSLNMVNVPLTIFAFLGGAAAIGVGFGSQNTVANFISGLILLIQRPIRIGDLIHADGIDANVEHIGARATRVRTSENVEVLIPNSNILQNNVTNWTLSDTRIRTSVTVGVAYGSPVRPVAEALEQVVAAHHKVLDDPEPIVVFEDFGDSSLVFQVHFWIHMQKIMDGVVVRSDIRMAIDDAFRRAGIVIAFPQRDVHLDVQSPIEVSLTDVERSVSRPRRAA